MTSPTCVACGAARVPGPECPSCGVIYARAEQRAAARAEADRSGPPLPDRRASAAWAFAHGRAVSAARAELRLAWFAVPGALLGCALLARTGLGQFLLRTFFGMWLHELGHAVAAWLCGFPAIPGPWVTSVSSQRSFLFALALAGGLGWSAWKGRTSGNRALATAAGSALVAQLLGTLVLSARGAATLISFAGDAGSLVFGAALMATFFVPPGHKLHRDWLRWGFLVIGAAAFVDAFGGWWAARTDTSAILFGAFEDGRPTDPTQLVQRDGWSVDAMIRRYVGTGVLSLAALVPLQLLHVRRSRAALEALEREAAP